ncbi:hypothetical protein PSI22_09580 [Xenorhabdus sp. XENO-7]|uniref:Uncharacterized protein n=1 Tax=Xenorhabdus aichiensis TaxID=3025874 RepID=A0ABT5M6K9_9GAMM|nr:hypothetical protein [Xenorhabdus aichiensis]MDC9621881.1 hypothetical protein [Xenorhabdus aichiensis]
MSRKSEAKVPGQKIYKKGLCAGCRQIVASLPMDLFLVNFADMAATGLSENKTIGLDRVDNLLLHGYSHCLIDEIFWQKPLIACLSVKLSQICTFYKPFTALGTGDEIDIPPVSVHESAG